MAAQFTFLLPEFTMRLSTHQKWSFLYCYTPDFSISVDFVCLLQQIPLSLSSALHKWVWCACLMKQHTCTCILWLKVGPAVWVGGFPASQQLQQEIGTVQPRGLFQFTCLGELPGISGFDYLVLVGSDGKRFQFFPFIFE